MLQSFLLFLLIAGQPVECDKWSISSSSTWWRSNWFQHSFSYKPGPGIKFKVYTLKLLGCHKKKIRNLHAGILSGSAYYKIKTLLLEIIVIHFSRQNTFLIYFSHSELNDLLYAYTRKFKVAGFSTKNGKFPPWKSQGVRDSMPIKLENYINNKRSLKWS